MLVKPSTVPIASNDAHVASFNLRSVRVRTSFLAASDLVFLCVEAFQHQDGALCALKPTAARLLLNPGLNLAIEFFVVHLAGLLDNGFTLERGPLATAHITDANAAVFQVVQQDACRVRTAVFRTSFVPIAHGLAYQLDVRAHGTILILSTGNKPPPTMMGFC
jgi:hypothetical protein